MKKKIILTVLGLLHFPFVGTLLWFTYRYMWFVTETIPPERVFVAMIGALFTGLAFWMYVSD